MTTLTEIYGVRYGGRIRRTSGTRGLARRLGARYGGVLLRTGPTTKVLGKAGASTAPALPAPTMTVS